MFFRDYDAALGRFTGIDALASQYSSLSTYHFGLNNPVMFNDPTGAAGEGMIHALYLPSGLTDGYSVSEFAGVLEQMYHGIWQPDGPGQSVQDASGGHFVRIPYGTYVILEARRYQAREK
jgi:uncharacterized protein RhaS with RHS repeats